jgi:UDP-glucose 4-epimerase
VAAPLARVGLVDFPPELADLLRYGRGVDNRRLCQAGFTYRHDSAGAVEQFVRARRLKRGAGRPATRYTYESDVEAFFRHSPAVVVREQTQ